MSNKANTDEAARVTNKANTDEAAPVTNKANDMPRTATNVDSQSGTNADLPQEVAEKPEAEVLLNKIDRQIVQLAQRMEHTHFTEYVQLLQRPRKLLLSNFLVGIARGVGIAVGFTFFAATIVVLLQKLGALNLPVVGNFIAEIVEIVQVQLEGRRTF